MQAEAKISHNEGRNCEKYKESVKERQTRANFEKNYQASPPISFC